MRARCEPGEVAFDERAIRDGELPQALGQNDLDGNTGDTPSSDDAGAADLYGQRARKMYSL